MLLVVVVVVLVLVLVLVLVVVVFVFVVIGSELCSFRLEHFLSEATVSCCPNCFSQTRCLHCLLKMGKQAIAAS